MVDGILALSGPQRKEKLVFPTESYCPQSRRAIRTLRRPIAEEGRALPASLDAPELHQPELFPPPDAALWTAGRSCASQDEREALLDHLANEIGWRSTQIHKMSRSAKGRLLDCCDYFDGRKFTLQELKRRHTELRGLLDRSAEFEATLNKLTRREGRRRKTAPLHLRLAAYLDPIARAGGGAWKACPSFDDLAKALDVSRDSLNRAFARLEEDPDCPLAFTSGYYSPTRRREKKVALKSWLKYDKLPLHFESEGRHRKLRPTFRKGVERIEPPALVAARHGRKATAADQAARSTTLSEYSTIKSGFRLSHSIGLSPAVLKDNPRWPAKHRSRPHKPMPRKAVLSKSLEKAAWRAAREAARDGELFWDNAKPKIPLPTLKTLILEAFEQGFEWQKHVRPALIYGIKEAHAAACLSDNGIRSPGAFAATIFRERIASMRPDPGHLAQVIEARRPKPAEPRPYVPLLSPPPSCTPEEARRFAEAEERASVRLESYMLENSAALAQLDSLEAFNDAMMAKLREFTADEMLK